MTNGLVSDIEKILKEHNSAIALLIRTQLGVAPGKPSNGLIAKPARKRARAKVKAKANGTPGKRGRKSAFSAEQVTAIQSEHKGGEPVLQLAKKYKVTPPTIYRVLAQ